MIINSINYSSHFNAPSVSCKGCPGIHIKLVGSFCSVLCGWIPKSFNSHSHIYSSISEKCNDMFCIMVGHYMSRLNHLIEKFASTISLICICTPLLGNLNTMLIINLIHTTDQQGSGFSVCHRKTWTFSFKGEKPRK